ncbi:unnamed protein product [Camellia sinensis]
MLVTGLTLCVCLYLSLECIIQTFHRRNVKLLKQLVHIPFTSPKATNLYGKHHNLRSLHDAVDDFSA